MKSCFFFLIFAYCATAFGVPGITYRQENTSTQMIHVMIVEPTKFNIILARALDMGHGRETVVSLAKRHNAVAAINGGFFSEGDPYDGQSQGILKIEDHWYGLAPLPRGAFGWTKDFSRTLFGRPTTHAQLFVDQQAIQIDRLGGPRKLSDVTLFTADFGLTTLTNPDRLETIIEGSFVSQKRHGGSSPIPRGGYVLSEPDQKKELPLNCNASFQIDVDPPEWTKMDYIVGGAPLLIKNGKMISDFSTENTLESFLTKPHARTAVGLLSDGRLLFVVVDGKQAGFSIGMTMHELASYMHSLGSVQALNLAGGSSSTLVFEEKIMNHPEGSETEIRYGAKKVSDAILVIPK